MPTRAVHFNLLGEVFSHVLICRVTILDFDDIVFCIQLPELGKHELKLEGDVLMITSGNNVSKNECPTYKS